MHETNEAVTLIMEAADEDAEIIFGTVIDEKLEDEVKVTVIATGLGGMDCVTTKNIETLKVEEKADEPQQVVEEAPLRTKTRKHKFLRKNLRLRLEKSHKR